MKTHVLMAMAIVAITSLTANAQQQRMLPRSGMNPREVQQRPNKEGFIVSARNLDEKQREEIKKIRLEQVKERTVTRNLLNEKRAKLNVLQTADKPDMKEVNKVIDEIAALQAREMKSQAAGRQKIRNLLTEEQRIQFDARGANKGKMYAKMGARSANNYPRMQGTVTRQMVQRGSGQQMVRPGQQGQQGARPGQQVVRSGQQVIQNR